MSTVGNSSAQSFLQHHHELWIDGEETPSMGDSRIPVLNPATGEQIADIAAATAEDVDRAVQAARRSFDDGRWRNITASERSQIMLRFADLIEQNVEELTALEVSDNGMLVEFARWQVHAAADWLRHYAGLARLPAGVNGSNALSGGGTEFHAYTSQEPVGVAAMILPWNGPFGMVFIKLAPALAAGCSCVIKPAENTPITALRVASLALEAGVPAGVLNIVTGYGAGTGQALVDHPLVDKISFTGSTAVGKRIVASASHSLKRVTLELGGKSPVLVFDDANLEETIPLVAMGIFANCGQVCFAGSRLYVQKNSYDKVVEGVAAFGKSMKVGSGFDADTQIGPLISAQQQSRVLGYVESGVSQGAEVLTGGAVHGNSGFFFEPTVIANVNASMSIVQEEIFGPVLVVTPVDDEDEFIAAANNSPYGLGAGIYTRDVSKAHRVARRLQAGNVWVNCYGIMHQAMPFGGFKESGWGREFGAEGLSAYQETKSVYVQL